jgi:hypothetical protein
VEYPLVKKGHIVPRSYLLNFAVDGQVCLNIDGRQLRHPVSIDDAPVRGPFYRRHRRDGTPIDDVEWSLSELEGAVAPIIQDVRGNWPPQLDTVKAPLAEFFAFQFIRGPRWKEWHEKKTREFIEQVRLNPEPVFERGLWIPMSPGRIDELEVRLLSETTWLTRMMALSNRILSVFASMTWHLVEFDEPVLAISDHPVVSWSLDGRRRLPEPHQHDLGVLNFLEVRAPISPTIALLMTWAEPPDTPKPMIGGPELAANLNAFSIANAERQWMSMPGSTVAMADGPFDPISTALLPGYGAAQAESSPIRKRVSESVERKIGTELHEQVDENGRQSAEIVTLREN